MNARDVLSNQHSPRPNTACASNYSPSSKDFPTFKNGHRRFANYHQAIRHKTPILNSWNEFNLTPPNDHFSNLRTIVDNSHNCFHSFHNDCIEECDDEQLGVSLELEIADSLKDLLDVNCHESKSANHNKSLDVTFIQQADSVHQTTLSLGMDEVTQLMDIVSDKTINHLKDKDSDLKARIKMEEEALQKTTERRKLLEERLNYYTSIENSTEDEFSDDPYDPGIIPPHLQQVYTSPHHTFDQIKSKLPCLTKSHAGHQDENDKPGTPCLCQHCGMVGVLIESQKRPAIPHSPNPKFTPHYPKHYPGHTGNSQNQHSSRHPKKIVDLRTKSKSETNIILLKELSTKIAALEDRLIEQEEKTVRKDYFKFVIHKLLTQYSNKINELRSANMYTNRASIDIATQYSKKTIHDRHRRGHTPEREREHERHYHVNVSTHHSHKSSTEEDCSIVSSDKCYRRIYKKLPKKFHSSRHDFHQGSSKIKEIYMTNDIEPSNNIIFQEKEESDGKLSAHAIKNLCDIVYNKYRDSKQSQDANSTLEENPNKVVPEKLGKIAHQETTSPTKNRNNLPQNSSHCAKHMDVSYVSPALKTWHVESEQEFAVANNSNGEKRRPQQHPPQDACNITTTGGTHTNPAPNNAKNKAKHSIEEKINYLKFLAKRKHVDESELWTNILNQAKKHIKSSEDTVSIQLPRIAHGPDMSELELTLNKLKEIVKASQIRKKKSVSSVEMKCSDDGLKNLSLKKRQGYLHKSFIDQNDDDPENSPKSPNSSRIS